MESHVRFGPTLTVTPFTFNAQLREQMEAAKAEVTLNGLLHKAKLGPLVWRATLSVATLPT
jgi:hypothetical protein